MKKFISLIVAAAMTITSISGSLAVSAVENTSNSNVETEYSVEGTNSFGNMIAEEISASEAAEGEEGTGNVITEVEMEGSIAHVEFGTVVDSTVVVAIYDESGETLLTTGHAKVTADETTVDITLDSSKIPQYYLVKAYIVNTETMRPIGKVYENPMYTQEMQEFLAKTTDDFAEDKVLNLDEDTTNNFAVYNDETVLIQEKSDVNTVVSANDETQVYVIENADESFTSLKSGDIFSYEYSDKILIVKVDTIKIDGTTVTITGEDVELSDVFSYIKIDEDIETDENTTVDTTSMDESFTYNGMVDSGVQTFALVDVESSSTKSTSLSLNDKKNGISGTIEFSVTVSYKFYYDDNWFSEDEFIIEFTTKKELSVGISAKQEVSLYEKKMPPITLYSKGILTCEVDISLVVEFSAEMTISGKLTKIDGFRVSSDNSGYEDLSQKGKFEPEVEVEGKFFIGIKGGIFLKAKIKLFGLEQEFAKIGLSLTIGAEVSSKKAVIGEVSDGVRHNCAICLEGNVTLLAELDFEVEVLSFFKLSHTLADNKLKLADFYVSTGSGLGLGKCPNKSYRVDVTVTTGDVPHKNASIDINKSNTCIDTVQTDESGKASFYLKNGTYELYVTTEDNYSESKKITVANEKKAVTVVILPYICEDSDNVCTGNEIKQVSLGYFHSAAITENGDLYTWGRGSSGQLGDGTTEYSYSSVPVKIMSNIKSVSLGKNHSAAITESGDLYTWGANDWGSLGDGTTEYSSVPVKIMSNIKSVSLGEYHSAAITESGDLYTWGHNGGGTLGDGTTEDSSVPVKIMSNIKSVSLGEYHSAAITENGGLYTWGYNGGGTLGDGTTEDSSVPVKIMSNVKSVSLGYDYSAAITESGDLYTWGHNYYGRLGDGTTEDSSVPVKIMSNIKSVSLGEYHSAAITESGDLYAWGHNGGGTLGDGTTEDSSVPVKIMSNIKSVSLGEYHSAAITESGDLYTWGDNCDGQLGDGTTEDSYVPVKITLPTEITTSTATLTEINSDSESTIPTFSDMLPNEIYNIYGMKSRTAEDPFSAENLLYIEQVISDENGNITYNYQPIAEYVNPVIFAKAETEFDVPNAQITGISGEDKSVTLTWNAVDGASKYTVYKVMNGIKIKVADIRTTSCTVPELNYNTEYGFIIQSWVNGEYSMLDENDMVSYTTGAFVEDTHTHKAAKVWSFDALGHWHDCTVADCTSKLDFAEHTESDWIIDKEATLNSTGIKHKECTICKYITVTEEIPVKEFEDGYLVTNSTTETKCGTWKEVNALFKNKNEDYIVTVYGSPAAEKITFPSATKAKSVTVKGYDETAKLTIIGASLSISCDVAFENITMESTNAKGFKLSSTKKLTINNFKTVNLNSLSAKDMYIESDCGFDSIVSATNLFMDKYNITANKNFTATNLNSSGGSINIAPTAKFITTNVKLTADLSLNYTGENYIPAEIKGNVEGGRVVIGLADGRFTNGDTLAKATKALADSFAISEASDPSTADVNYTLSKQKTEIKIAAEAILLEDANGEIGRYALWTEAMAKIEALKNSQAAYSITMLTDLPVNAALKMPKKDTYAELTVKGTGTETITFTGSITLTGNTAFENINLDSAKKTAKGVTHSKFNITAGAFKLTLENVNNSAPEAMLTNVSATGKKAETALTIANTAVKGNLTANYAEIENAEVTGNVTVTYLKADNLAVNGNLNAKSALELGNITVKGTITADNIKADEDAKLTVVKGKKFTIGKNGFTADSARAEVTILEADGTAAELVGETVFVSTMNAAYNDNFTLSEANTGGRPFVVIKSSKTLLAVSENGLVEVATETGSLGKFRNLTEAMAEITSRNIPTENYTVILREDTAQLAKFPLPTAKKYTSVKITSEIPVTINARGAISLTGDLTIDENVTVNAGTTAAAVTTGKYHFILKGNISYAGAENEIKTLSGTETVTLERSLTVTGTAKAGKIILADGVKLTLGTSLAAEIEAGLNSMVSYSALKAKAMIFTKVTTPVTVEIDGIISEGMQIAATSGEYSAPITIYGSDMTVVKSGTKLVAVAVPVKLNDGTTERLYDTVENAVKDISAINNPTAVYTITISGDANGEFVRARLPLPARGKYAGIRFTSESAVTIKVTSDIALTGDLIIGENVTLKKTDRYGNDAVLKIKSPTNSGFTAYEENGGKIVYVPFGMEGIARVIEVDESVIDNEDYEIPEEDTDDETDETEAPSDENTDDEADENTDDETDETEAPSDENTDDEADETEAPSDENTDDEADETTDEGTDEITDEAIAA